MLSSNHLNAFYRSLADDPIDARVHNAVPSLCPFPSSSSLPLLFGAAPL